MHAVRQLVLSIVIVLTTAAGAAAQTPSVHDRIAAALPGAVDRARTWLLQQQRPDGWFTDNDIENALIALALAESNAPLSDDRMKRLVAAMLNAQPQNHRFEALRLEFLMRLLAKMTPTVRKAAEATMARDLAALAKAQRPDGAWPRDGGNWQIVDTTFDAWLALYLLRADGAKVPDLTKPVATLLQKQKDNGPWSFDPFNDPGGGNNRECTIMATILLSQMGSDQCTCRNKGASKVEEALQKAIEKATAHGEFIDAYADWGKDPNKVRDGYFWMQGYYMARLQQCAPRDNVARANVLTDWYRMNIARPQDDGHAMTPRNENGGHQDVWATGLMLYQFAQRARPVLVTELLDDPTKAVSANSGLLNAVETLSLRWPQPVRYDRARAGLDFDRYRKSPLVYLHATDAFRLAQEERDNLRRYAAGGGTILIQLDCGDKTALEPVRRELAAIWPALKLDALQRSHPMWSAAGDTAGTRPVVLGLDDGVRTFVFVFQSNLICDLGRGRTGAALPAYQTFDAIAAYALEGQTDFSAPLVDAKGEAAELKLPAAAPLGVGLVKLKCMGADGPALPYNGWAAVAEALPKDAALKVLGPRPVDIAGLAMCDVAYLPCREDTRLEEDEAAALTAYLAGGGWLVLEPHLGGLAADRGAQRIIASLRLKTRPVKVDEALVSGKFSDAVVGFNMTTARQRVSGALRTLPTDVRLLVTEDGKTVGVYSPLDLVVSASGVRCYGLRGYAPVDARRLLANLLLSRVAK